MRDGENIRDVENLGIDLMGFIFYPKSPRYVADKPTYLPQSAKRVGVFVNESLEIINSKIEAFSLDYVQLHGNETTGFCTEVKNLGVKIIKAFQISVKEDFLLTTEYEKSCDLFVFDTKCDSYGGSGVSFDWNLLNHYKGKTPFLLSGGLGVANKEKIKKVTHSQLIGYDLNSHFESSPAIKDIKRIKKILENE